MRFRIRSQGAVLIFVLLLSALMSLIGLQMLDSSFLARCALSNLEQANQRENEAAIVLEQVEKWLDQHWQTIKPGLPGNYLTCEIQHRGSAQNDTRVFFEIACPVFKTHYGVATNKKIGRMSWFRNDL